MKNLEKIKEMAILFLHLPVELTDIPFIISHPFSNTITVMIDQKRLNILDQKEKDIWLEKMEQKILEQNSVLRIFMMLNKPYCLSFLKMINPFLASAEVGEILGTFWISIEYCSADKNITNRDLVNIFKKADKSKMMSKKELEFLDALPETVTIYRGVTKVNEKITKALSWTTKRETAEWFANRFHANGTVLEKEINKNKILCCFLGRGEEEVIVNNYK